MRNSQMDLTTSKIRELMADDIQNELEFIGRASDYRDEVENGNIFKVSKFGLRRVDHHAPFKSSHLILNVGHPNVGKTFLDFFLMVMLSRTSGIKWLVYSAENRIAAMIKQIISLHYSKPYKFLSQQQKDEGFEWVDAHFKFILHIRMYTYKQLISMAIRTMDEQIEFDGVLIDPYNSLKLELKGLQKNDYNILRSQIR